MIRFVFGGAGSGKTKYVTDDIRRVLRETDKRVFLLVPEQQTVVYETKLAREFSPEYATRLEATSFTRLADTVARKTGGLARPNLSGGVRALLTWRALSSVWDSLTYLSSAAGAKNTLVPAVASALNELRINGVGAEDLERAVSAAEADDPDSSLTLKMRDLLTVNAAYQSIISEEYGEGVVEGAAAHIIRRGAESGFFANTALYVDSFFSVTKEEYGVISDLMRHADDVTVTVAMESRDSALVREEPVRSFFRYLNADAARFGGAEIVTLGENRRAKTDGLRTVSKYLFDYGRDGDVAASGGDSVRVFSVEDRYAEAEAAASVIEKFVSEGCRYSDIAVIAGDVSALRGVTESCFARHSIPCFLTESARMEASPMTRALLSLLRIPGEWRREDVMALVKTGLTPLTEEESCLFEDYAGRWNVRGRRMFTSDWSFNPSGYKIGFTESEKEILGIVNGARRKLIPAVETFCETFRGGEADVRTVCEALVRYTDESGLFDAQMDHADRLEEQGDRDGAARERMVWKNFCKCFDTIVTLLPGVKVDADGFSSVLRYAMTDTGSGAIPTGVDEVAFGSAGSIRTGEVRHVILLGCADKEFPRAAEDRGFFTDADKNAMEDMGIDLWSRSREKAAMELLRFHRCASLSSDTLTLFVPETSFGAATEISSGARDVLALIGRSEPDDFASLPPEERLFRPAGLDRELEYAVKKGDGDLEEALRELRRSRFPEADRKFDGFLYETVSAENAEKLFGGSVEISDSRLESFARCPFSYYMKHVLRLKDSEKAELTSVNVGVFVHQVLDRFFKVTAGREYPLCREETERICDEIIEDYVAQLCGDNVNQRTEYLFRRLRNGVLLFVEAVMKELSDGEFKVFGTEIVFGTERGDLPPLVFTTGDGEELKIRGTVDRLDVCEKDGVTYLKVVDYKTYTARFDADLVEKGLNVQLLLYLFSMWKGGDGASPGPWRTPVPAGAVYCSVKDLETTEDHMIGEEEAREKLLNRIERSGVILGEDGVPGAMFPELSDSDAEDKKARKSGGGKYFSYETAEGFGRLYEKLENVIGQIAEEMKKGVAAVRPVDEDHAGCSFCPGRRICKNECAYKPKGRWSR